MQARGTEMQERGTKVQEGRAKMLQRREAKEKEDALPSRKYDKRSKEV